MSDDTERKLKAQPEPDLTDPDNPEWTEEDFARAQGPEALSAAELAAFPRTRNKGGRPRLANPKQQVTLRLSQSVLNHFKATGAGWQARIEDVLKAEMERSGKH